MLRRVVAVLLLSALVLSARQVRANYTDARVTGEDVRAKVERDGSAVVTHVIAYRVLAGTVRTIALAGFESDLRFRPTATVTASDGHAGGASVVRDDQDIVHVTLDDPKGLKRGDYHFEIVYETSLVGRVTRDGAFARVRFALPPLREGIDGARLVLDLPSAPTEPRAATEGAEADLPTLRRMAERDELELVRPHVPKGEAATFYARIDPKALSEMTDPALREAPATVHVDAPREQPPLGRAIVVVGSALVIFGIALAKGRLLAAGSGASASGLVPIGPHARAALAAMIFSSGVLAELSGRIMPGAALVASSLPLLAWRIIAVERGVRGPAKWLVVKPSEVFVKARARADFLDATTIRGALVLALVSFAVALGCRLARAGGGVAPYLVAMDALALVPIFFTGTSCQRPPNAAREGAALAPLARAISSSESLKVAPLARVLANGSDDEVRLLVSPRLAMTGVAAVEVGVAWERATNLMGGVSLPSFDVLVRVHDASFAAAKMAAAFPTMRALPGRKPEERVFRFEPADPRVASCAALVRNLAETLRDRRLVVAAGADFEGDERRIPPNARVALRAQEAAA